MIDIVHFPPYITSPLKNGIIRQHQIYFASSLFRHIHTRKLSDSRVNTKYYVEKFEEISSFKKLVPGLRYKVSTKLNSFLFSKICYIKIFLANIFALSP